MKKRLVAFLLVLIMVLGMLPVSAMAAGSVVTARGSAENPIRIYENSGNQAETSNGSVQVPVGETVTDSGVLTFSTYSAIEGVQVSKGGVYCAVTSSNENVVKATGSWSGGVLTINFLGVGNGTAKITVDYTCTCSKNAVANGLLIYNVTVGDGGSTDPSGKPNAPTASDIGAFPDAGKAVLLHCVDAGARGHDATASSLNKVQNGYSVGEVVENPGTYYNVDGGKITKEQFPWMCVVTVHAAPFIELYNSNFSERYGVHKLAGTSNATATLHWFWHNTYGWQYLENPPIQFNITRDTSEKTYTLNYYKNTTDTVTNMPEPNPQTEKSNTGMVTFTVSSAIPAREGYNFLGWNGKPDATTPTVQPGNWVTTPATTTKLYAVWQSNTPPTDKPANPTTYTVESDTITLADATGADWGKTFLEWHDENGQKITEIPTGSTGDRVITAYWNWPVHLHYLDKDNNEIESATLYVSELEPGACVLPTGEKTGYDFDGWYEAQKDIGTASHKLNALSIAKKWELYGRYTAKTDVSYTVKYLREGDNKVLAPEKVVTDQTFDTEVTEQAADVVGYTPDAPSKTMILDEYNKVLTFSYSANTYDYTVRHIKQLPDGSYDEANAEVETLSGKFEALAAVTAKDYGEHYPTNDADTKQNIKIEEGLTIDVKYDLDEHTLTFETNGGSAINPVTVRHGNAVARPADPTKDKYTFIGWYADPEFTEEYDFATVLEADKTIYAKFELTSTPIGDIYVRYDVLHIKQLPDGTYDLANAEVEHLSAKKDTTVTAVIKDYRATHHVNVNRTLSKLTGTAIQPYKGVDGKPVYTILSVYYDLDFHTLTFDTMGGSKIAPETVRHGLTVAKPKDPVNGGYIFDGWYTDKTYRTPYNFATPLTQDTTIYAKWFLIVLPGVTDKKATPKLNTSDHFAYVQGYPNGTVKPAGNITRAETAAILFRLMDDASRKTYYSTKSGFRDVASGSWYNTYVATLNNAGVITDSSNGYFRPNEAITRAELAAMLAKFSETTGAANYFNDVSAKYWAANAIAICAKLGWITGYPDGTFRPDKNVTRAELMAMINRATGRAPKSADAFLPGMKTWIDNTSDKWYYLDVQEATNSHSYTVKGSETWTALTSDPNWSLYE